MTSEGESALFHYLHLLVNTHRYVHCALNAVVDTVDQFELVLAIRNPTKLRLFPPSGLDEDRSSESHRLFFLLSTEPPRLRSPNLVRWRRLRKARFTSRINSLSVSSFSPMSIVGIASFIMSAESPGTRAGLVQQVED